MREVLSVVAARLRVQDEDGIGLVELLIAVFVLTVGVLALAATLDSSRGLTSVAERQNAAAHIAERQIERLQALSFDEVALRQAPTEPLTGEDAAEPPVVASDGAVDPGPDDAGEGVSVTRYVTLASDPSCPSCAPGRLKRITVVVTAGPDGRKRAVRTSALVADPERGAANATLSPRTECLGDDGTPVECAVRTSETASWYLTDTPLSAGVRQPVAASHATHPTVAPQAGAVTPDLLSSEPVPAGATVGPLHDYSTDVVGAQSSPGGRVLRRDTGCDGTPSDTDNTKGAMWTTTALDEPLSLTGKGGFSLSTQTFEGVTANVTMCAAFYDLSTPADAPAPASSEIARVSYTRSAWPSSLSQFSFTFNLGREVTLAEGHRLGVRLWVSDASGADAIFAYDHPSFPGHLQLAIAPAS